MPAYWHASIPIIFYAVQKSFWLEFHDETGVKRIMDILLTGGTGYIGSHTAVSLIEAGHNVYLYDNLSNSQADVVDKLEQITGKKIPFIQADVRDTEQLKATLREYKIEAVMHFAGYKAVGESVENPLKYFDNNIQGVISVLQAMQAENTRIFVFSSSATVYGVPKYLPFDEEHPTESVNPYGQTKLHTEEMLRDLAKSDPSWRIISLRYFNPVGAHPSGLIGDSPNGIPNNLMPFIAQVAFGKLPRLKVFGNDYDTPDGTGVRDYIHVTDLADGHSSAIPYLAANPGYHVINLGTEQGYSVLEMVKAFEDASGVEVPYEIAPRRPGDIDSYYAKAEKAKQLLGWQAKHSLYEMCSSTWHFQSKVTDSDKLEKDAGEEVAV